MGTIVIGSLIDRARRQLFELDVGDVASDDVRYDRVLELLPLANAAQRAICIHRPSAYTKNGSMALGPGAKQTIPSDGTQLGNVEHNLGADGETPGRAITIIDRLALTRLDPNWMTKTGSAVQHYVHDQRDPKTFYVYPRPSGDWYVNLSYPAIPNAVVAADIDDETDGLIAVDDIYDTAIVNFIVGYALMKNTKMGDTSRASVFLSQFEQITGVQLQRQQDFAPLDQPAAEAAANALGKP